MPRLTAREFRGTLRLDKNALVFDEMSGEVAGGRVRPETRMSASESSAPVFHATTIILVKKCGRTVIGGDGQVTMGLTLPGV